MTHPAKLMLPSKDQIKQLPTFVSLPLEQVRIIRNKLQCDAIADELAACTVLGFDSESKPTFKKGEIQTGPHLIQLASAQKVYLFQMNAETWPFLIPILESSDQLKVGFGLKNDAHLLWQQGIKLNTVIDLSRCFGSFGLKQTVGVQTAVALLLQQHFPKSKAISTSNWANPTLSEMQIAYAAADAYACVVIFAELRRLGLLQQVNQRIHV